MPYPRLHATLFHLTDEPVHIVPPKLSLTDHQKRIEALVFRDILFIETQMETFGFAEGFERVPDEIPTNSIILRSGREAHVRSKP